ncbi:uncharacterized protein LOC142239436 [Haematobia irritans]|uniref:uncharacterized protein LOC142239436 n=1 Tax=Haematobia irritans TaxID=7368 RepID=UPI003F5092BA
MKRQQFICVITTILVITTTQTTIGSDDTGKKTVKKDLEKENQSLETTSMPHIDNKPHIENASSSNIGSDTKEINKKPDENITKISATDKKENAVVPSTVPASHFFHQDEVIMQSNEEISDSLKTGFYFFVALSLSAVLFIIFKVYRLRLSRAERKYGVQGDRTTQELTPLPIGIEDGHSEDEDQTVFELNRQNIRIL